MTGLIDACSAGDFKRFLMHLEKCENLKCVDDIGNGLLHNSIDTGGWQDANTDGRLAIITTLIQKGLDVDLINKNGETPLHLALSVFCPSCSYCLPIIKCLVDNGCDVNIKDNRNQSPLDLACRSDENLDIVKLLIEHGAHVKQFSCSTINTIAGNNDLQMLSLLFDCGLELTLENLSHSFNCPKDELCLTDPLQSALVDGYIEMARLFIHKGVNVKSKLRDGLYCIHYLVRAGQIELIEFVLNRDADVNSVCDKLETPLCWACFQGNLDAVKFLLDRGGDPFHRNIKGESLMPYAVKGGNVEIVTVLSDLGIPFEKIVEERFFPANHKFSPLSIAAYFRHISVFEFLLIKGFKVDEKENNGFSVIHLAAMGGQSQIVKRILYLGANVNLKSDNGETPLSIALEHSYSALCYMLINCYGASLNCKTKQGDSVLETAIMHVLQTSLSDIDEYTYYGFDANYCIIDEALSRKAAGLDYSDDKIKSSTILSHLSPPKIINSAFYAKCENEIKLLKQVTINENQSLYHFLCSDVFQCARIIRLDETEHFLVSLKPFNKFPSYCSKLTSKINRAVRMKHLIKIAVIFFESLDTEPRLNNDSIDILVSYLDIPSLMTIEVALTGTNVVFNEED